MNPLPTGMTQAEDPFPPRPRPAPMSLRTQWRLGARFLAAAWVASLPASIFVWVTRISEQQAMFSIGLAVLLGLISLAGMPLWAAWLLREWAATGEAGRLVEEARTGRSAPSTTAGSHSPDAA